MTRNEWINWHNDKAVKRGEEEFCEKFCTEIFSPEHGIFQYVVEGDTMVMKETIGHLFYWEDWALWICRTIGVTKMVSYYKTDNPRKLERLYKAKAYKENDYYRFERSVC